MVQVSEDLGITSCGCSQVKDGEIIFLSFLYTRPPFSSVVVRERSPVYIDTERRRWKNDKFIRTKQKVFSFFGDRKFPTKKIRNLRVGVPHSGRDLCIYGYYKTDLLKLIPRRFSLTDLR